MCMSRFEGQVSGRAGEGTGKGTVHPSMFKYTNQHLESREAKVQGRQRERQARVREQREEKRRKISSTRMVTSVTHDA